MSQLEKVHSILKYLGFTENEVKVYIALLKKKICSPAEVVRISGLKRVKVYDLLKSLESKGGCILQDTGKKLYEAVDPDLLMKRSKSKLKDKMDLLDNSISKINDELLEIYRKSVESDTEIDYITVLKDPVVYACELIRLSAQIQKECLLFSVNPKMGKVLEKFSKNDWEILKDVKNKYGDPTYEIYKEKGAVFHSLTGLENLNPDLIKDNAGPYRDNENIDTRIVDRIPCKIMIYDRKDVIVDLKNRADTGSSISFHIRDEGFAELLRNMFYMLFDSAPSVKDLDVDILLNEGRIVRLSDE
ncbi:MAG: hypothetical protein KAW14_11540 [Candidatus Aegiribacteria sp.]|nr:hypothetical protein [Candidatus Aegiribacteria sp.]